MFEKQDGGIKSLCGLCFFALIFCAAPVFASGERAANEVSLPAAPAASETAPDVLEKGTAGSYLSSRFARQNGDVAAAIAYLTKTIEKKPQDMALYVQLVGLQVSQGNMEDALKSAHRLSEAKVQDTLANLLLTIEAAKKQDYAAASAQLNQGFEESSGQLWLPLMDAWLEIGQHKMKKPLTLEEMPVTVGRAASVMNYHLALINSYAGFADQATQHFADAVESPEAASLRMMQYMQNFSAEHRKPAALEELIAQYEAANSPLTPLDSPLKTPADGISEVLYTMGNIMQITGVSNDAAVYMQLARYLRPDFYLATFNLAEILSENKEYLRANALLQEIPASSPYAFKASLRNAILLERMGKHADAMDLLAKLAAQHPKQPDPWIAKGDLLRIQKRFLEASISYGEAIARIGTPVRQHWSVFYARGACFERMDRWNEAKADLQKALDLNPEQPDVLNYLGYGLMTRGESINEAKGMLETALSFSPNDPQIIDSMGWALYLSGAYKDALPYLERAVELLPGDVTVNDHLGDVYWQLGRQNEARFQWERALSFAPDDVEAQKIHAKITDGMHQLKLPSSQAAAVKQPENPKQ